MKYGSIFRALFFMCGILAVSFFIFPGAAQCLELGSDAFEGGGNIPVRYTGFGEDISPPLRWGDVPEGTKSFALIMDDPDAPVGTWIHWVIYDIPGDATGLDENIPPTEFTNERARQGINSFRRIGYGGPHPPPGPAHRYIFDLYALDAVLGVPPGAGGGEVMKAMQGHILKQACLTGLFGR
ncbi:MAG: YbhB/YbcL family Raf kinase inhibitor-like protein [Candidatus Omnitrophota bacterium]|nr:YbhB/YbcL family Raf kinase inhibitor-like protein [Candidatus Omnitrophota bacterium]